MAGLPAKCVYCGTRDKKRFRRGRSWQASLCIACEKKRADGTLLWERDPLLAAMGAKHHPRSCLCRPCRLWKQIETLNAVM